jgi:PIN domain nuclease of toxin-antitoxin system
VKLLLDTPQPGRLSAEAIAHLADETNEVWFSVASVWEMGIKVAIGKLPLPEPIDSYQYSDVSILWAANS